MHRRCIRCGGFGGSFGPPSPRSTFLCASGARNGPTSGQRVAGALASASPQRGSWANGAGARSDVDLVGVIEATTTIRQEGGRGRPLGGPGSTGVARDTPASVGRTPGTGSERHRAKTVKWWRWGKYDRGGKEEDRLGGVGRWREKNGRSPFGFRPWGTSVRF